MINRFQLKNVYFIYLLFYFNKMHYKTEKHYEKFQISDKKYLKFTFVKCFFGYLLVFELVRKLKGRTN